MSVADYFPLVQQLYIAYFGRPADPTGLQEFARQLNGLGAPTDITGLGNEYRAAGPTTLRALVDGFGNSGESARLYGNGDSAAFVRAVFANVLNRQPQSSGLEFWVAELDSGRVSRSEAAMRIMAGAFNNTTNPNQAASDQKTILNRVGAASYFTAELDTAAERSAYRGPSPASHARAMLDDVGNIIGWESYKPFIDATVARMSGSFPVRDTTMVSSKTAYTGTAAAERIAIPDTLGGYFRPVAMGEGDDLVLLLEARFSSNAAIDGGAGTDTLAMIAADANLLAGAGKASLLRQFERLELIDASYRTVKVDGLGDFAQIALAREPDGVLRAVRLEGVASGATISADGTVDDLRVMVKDALNGQANVVNVVWQPKHAEQLSSLTIDHVDTIHLSAVFPAPSQPLLSSMLKLSAAQAGSVTLAGDGPVNVRLETPALVNFDASAYLGRIEMSAPKLAMAAVLKGGAGDNYIGLARSTQHVEYVGGAGRDFISGGGAPATIRTGAGIDSVSLDLGSSVVDLGEGDDLFVIHRADSANVVTGGAGVDAFYFNSPTASSKYTIARITDLSAGETIRFMGYGGFVAEDKIGAALALGSSASFDQYLDAAAAGATRGTVHWFVLGEETFIVTDLSSASSFVAGGDMVVKLAGVHDLSGAGFSAEGLFTMAAV